MNGNRTFPFAEMMAILRDTVGNAPPVVTRMSRKKETRAFHILVGTLLSLRTRDETTDAVMERLTGKIKGPEDILAMPHETLERLIYPVGFYRTKARVLKDVSRVLTEDHGGKVPDALDALLAIKGIGRKTANLVITEAFGKPGICVDTHVHRISNRLGIVATKHPHQTEEGLRSILPGEYWMSYNSLLVTFGKTICTPLSPRCSLCPLNHLCERVGVGRFR